MVIDMNDAVRNQGGPSQRAPSRRRQVVDEILIAFHFACDQDDLEVADQLLAILDFMRQHPLPAGHPERRADTQPLVSAHERLWHLRHPETSEAWD